MQFRTPKADRSFSLRSLLGRKADKKRRPALAPEFLEPRQLLAAASFTAVSINIAAQEGAPFASQPVARITDNAVGVGVNDYAATIDWGDNSSSSIGQIATTAQSGVFQVLGSHTYAEEGSDNLRIIISKDAGTASTFTGTATVSDPPVMASGGYTVLAVEGTAPANQLLATFIDPGGPEAVGDYSATIAWGDGATTAGAVAYNSALGAFVVTGGAAHSYTAYGTDTVTVTIKHDKAATATVTDTAVVSDPAVLGQGGFTYTASEGNTATAQTLATFTDPGGAEAATHYSATIDWGDGNTTAGTVQSIAGGQFGVLGNHAYLEEGKGTIKVILNHDISPPVTVTSAFNISDPSVSFAAPKIIKVNEGVLLNNVTMGTFLDPGGPEDVGDYSAQINWGDGTLSPGVVSFSVANNIYTVAGTHDYLTAGVHNTKVVLSHDASQDATLVGSAIVSDVAVVGTGGFTLAAVEGAQSANQLIATFTDPGVIGDPTTDYSATVDWGDGGISSATSGITFDSGRQVFSVNAQHTYAEEGSYPITVTIGHDQATAVTVASTAQVTDPAVQAVGGATVSALEYRTFSPQDLAEFTDPGGGEASDYSATINWGDGSISGGQIVPSGSGFSVQASHLYTQFGVFNPTVTIHHDTAPDFSVSDTVNVGVPPIQLTALPATWREWTVPVELSPLASTSFTDTQMTAVVSWGDGSTSAGVITPDLLGTVGTVRGSHVYAEAGDYLVTVTVLDGGQSTSLTIPTTVMRELLPIANTNAGTPNQYYVAEVYGDVLGRAVDGGGLQYWSSLLDQGAPRASVTNALLSSNEYLGNFVIGPAYQKYLGRAADPGGVNYWLGQMHLGLSDQGLVAALASSPEFFAKSGGTNLSFVNGLYQALLGRPADSAGQTYWVGLLNAGISRFNVALSFAISAEDTADMVINDYQHMLGRGPSAGELNQWVTAFSRGTTSNEGLIATLAASDEYFSLANSE